MKTDALINQIIGLFLIMLIGFIAYKKHLLDKELTTGLAKILLHLALPFTIIASFNLKFSPRILHNVIILFFCAVLAHIIPALLSLILYPKYPEADRKVLRFSTIFSNTGFVGLPVIGSIFGTMGVFYGSIYVGVFNIFAWTLGIGIFTGKKNINVLEAFLTPAFVAVFLGLILFLFSLQLPIPIARTIDIIGSITTPLSMIVIGAMLAQLKFNEIFTGFPVYYGTIVRLLLIPLTMALLLHLFGIQEYLLKISITSTAMPAATMTALFAEQYNGNTLLASRLIFISTALSIITIPLIVFLV